MTLAVSILYDAVNRHGRKLSETAKRLLWGLAEELEWTDLDGMYLMDEIFHGPYYASWHVNVHGAECVVMARFQALPSISIGNMSITLDEYGEDVHEICSDNYKQIVEWVETKRYPQQCQSCPVPNCNGFPPHDKCRDNMIAYSSPDYPNVDPA